MNFEPLMDALIGVILFLELSKPPAVDDDAAVGAMEGIAHTLGQLGRDEQAAFCKRIQHQLLHAESARERACLGSLAEALGLAEA